LTIGEEALWKNLKSECRNRIRKAERLGIQVRHEQSGEFVDDFWAMSTETFARAGAQPTHNRLFAESLWQRLAPHGRLIVLSAFHEGRRIATLVLPCDGRAAYYWGGAARAETRHLPAANLLHWEAIRESLRRGLAGYDFNSTTGGPGRFKQTFGPTKVRVATHWERTPSALLAMLKRGVERYRRGRPAVAA
jgi:lipid II:glycine glycyltransferase (peptidoglycan interpeptide bridge formation enzyme)